MTADKQRGIGSGAMALIAVGFGLLTIKEGGTVLFGEEVARASAGNYVPFVLWFNFLAGFAYVIAGAGLWRLQRWAVWLAIVIAVATLIVFAAFGIHILSDGVWEQRTLVAMILRSLVWITIAATSARCFRQRRVSATCEAPADREG
jgi:cytochrome c oxidase subunit IV